MMPRHGIDLRTLAYLVCGPMLIAGVVGLLGTVSVPNPDTFGGSTSCGSVIDHGADAGEACADAISSRGDWSYPVAGLGLVGLVAAAALRKSQNDEKPRHPGEDTGA